MKNLKAVPTEDDKHESVGTIYTLNLASEMRPL